jgi:hypothetical protein
VHLTWIPHSLLDSSLSLAAGVKEAKDTVDLLNRVTMTFDIVLEKSNDGAPPKVKIVILFENLLFVFKKKK